MSQSRANPHQTQIIKLFLSSLTSSDFDDLPLSITENHVAALLYLVNIKKIDPKEGFARVKKLSWGQAAAMSYGCISTLLPSMSEEQAQLLARHLETAGLQMPEQIIPLSSKEREIVMRLYSFGVDSELIVKHRTNLLFTLDVATLNNLIKYQGYLIENLLEMAKELNQVQLYGISEGLKRDEVVDLQLPQIKALINCKNIGLSAEMLRSNPQLNSDWHFAFLDRLIENQSLHDAISEVAKYDAKQCEYLMGGITKEEVLTLNNYQLELLQHIIWNKTDRSLFNLDTFRKILKPNSGFCSRDHLNAFWSVKNLKDIYNYYSRDTTTSTYLELEKMTPAQAVIKEKYDASTNDVMKMTPIKIALLDELTQLLDKFKPDFCHIYLLGEADWLISNLQKEVIKRFITVAINHSKVNDELFRNVLNIVKQSNDHELQSIYDNKVSNEQLLDLLKTDVQKVQHIEATTNDHLAAPLYSAVSSLFSISFTQPNVPQPLQHKTSNTTSEKKLAQ